VLTISSHTVFSNLVTNDAACYYHKKNTSNLNKKKKEINNQLFMDIILTLTSIAVIVFLLMAFIIFPFTSALILSFMAIVVLIYDATYSNLLINVTGDNEMAQNAASEGNNMQSDNVQTSIDENELPLSSPNVEEDDENIANDQTMSSNPCEHYSNKSQISIAKPMKKQLDAIDRLIFIDWDVKSKNFKRRQNVSKKRSLHIQKTRLQKSTLDKLNGRIPKTDAEYAQERKRTKGNVQKLHRLIHNRI
jgi:uncharacterized membrane protein